MTWIALCIGTIMVADGLFALTNRTLIEEELSMHMSTPVNLSKMALIELCVGIAVIVSGVYAQIKL